MRATCLFYRSPESQPIADGLDRACQSEICAMAKQSYINEVCRLGTNILETLIMCSIASGMSIFAAAIAHFGGNEDRGFSFAHVGKDEHTAEEELLLVESKVLDSHEEKVNKKKETIQTAKDAIKKKKEEEKRKKKALKKAKARKKKKDKERLVKEKKIKDMKDARDKLKLKHTNAKQKKSDKKKKKKVGKKIDSIMHKGM